MAALAGDPGAKVLAGGQSLVPLLSMRLAAPSLLVDINGLPGLDTITVEDGGVRVGALARHADVLASEDVRRVQPLVAMALSHVAHATIRNRGTTVGSLVHADAAAEMPVVLTLLGGSLDVEGPGGRRTIAAGDLFVGPLESSVHHDEIAVSAFFPGLAPGAGVAFDEIARRHGDYALVGAARRWSTATRCKVGYLSVSDVPTVVDLSGVRRRPSSATPRSTQLDPADDIHATADYRAHLVRVLTERVVRSAREGSAHDRGAPRRPADRQRHRRTRCGVPARRLLSDALRHDLGLTGTHVGCEHGVCGACTVLVDGRPMRSCLMFAVSAEGPEITTVEGLTEPDGSLGPVQQAFLECHGLQCGFCTPGFLTTITAGLRDNPEPTHEEARDMIAGNLCRCTGYQNIVKAVERAAEIARGHASGDRPPAAARTGVGAGRVRGPRRRQRLHRPGGLSP